MLDNTPNQPTKFRTKNSVKTNDDSCGTYNTNSQIRFKTSMLRSNLYHYSDPYILVGGSRTVPNTETAGNPSNRKNIINKNCAPFADCKSEINNTQIDNTKYIDMVMPRYSLIGYSNNYSKTSGNLRQFFRDELFINKNGAISDFPDDNNNSTSFKFETKVVDRIGHNGTN